MIGNSVVIILFISASFYMIKYTDFDVLYKRILGTEIHGYNIDTRSGWPLVIEKILEKPIWGHGSRLVTKDELTEHTKWPKGEIDFYPHNLYLYILYTLGIVGLIAYGAWGLLYFGCLRKIPMQLEHNTFISGLPKLGIILFIVILIDQMKVVFLRSSLLHYQHYLSVIFGMFCSLKKIGEKSSFINKHPI